MIPAATKSLGGSEVGAAVGLSPYCSPIRLWLEKTGQRARKPVQSEAAFWGTQLEPVLRQHYANVHRVEIEVPETLYRGWRRASPDGLFLPKRQRGLEIKTGDLRMAQYWGEPGSDEVPASYLCQVVWYMALVDIEAIDFAVLLGGNRYSEYRVARDLELEDRLMDLAADFWGCVNRKQPPPIDHTVDYSEYLADRYPFTRDSYIKAGPQENAWADELATIYRQIAALEKHRATLANRLKAAIGEHAGMRTAAGKVTWKATKAGTRPFRVPNKWSNV